MLPLWQAALIDFNGSCLVVQQLHRQTRWVGSSVGKDVKGLQKSHWPLFAFCLNSWKLMWKSRQRRCNRKASADNRTCARWFIFLFFGTDEGDAILFTLAEMHEVSVCALLPCTHQLLVIWGKELFILYIYMPPFAASEAVLRRLTAYKNNKITINLKC